MISELSVRNQIHGEQSLPPVILKKQNKNQTRNHFVCWGKKKHIHEILLTHCSHIVADATKSIQYGVTQNEAPGSPAPGLEAEVRRLREENANLKERVSGRYLLNINLKFLQKTSEFDCIKNPFLCPICNLKILYFVETSQKENDLLSMQQELESSESKKTSQLKQLEKSNKILKQEKEDALRVIIHVL